MLPSPANSAAHTARTVTFLYPARYETVILDGTLYSDLDFEEEEFVTFGGMHFFYIRTALAGSGHGASDDVYTISSNDKVSISIIPFEDVGKSKLLKAGEELRNGDYQVDGNVFTFESAVYNQKTANVVDRKR